MGVHFCPVKVHMSNRVKEVLIGSGMSKTALADRLGMSRSNLYKVFDREDIDAPLLRRLSKVLGHDFIQDLTGKETVQEAQATYREPEPKSKSSVKIVIDIDPEDADRLEESGFLKRLAELMKEIN